jgi:dihydroorotase
MSYDLLIKAEHVLDPGQNLDGPSDIGITDGRITAILQNIPATDAKRTIEVRGANRYVVPGLIDLHVHVAVGAMTEGLGIGCVDPDLAGIRAGVTTVVDAGSTSPANFGPMRAFIMPQAKTRLICHLRVVSRAFAQLGYDEISRLEDVDARAFARAVEANPGLISGVKLRTVGKIMDERGEDVVRLSKDIAREHGLPLTVHSLDPAGDVAKRQALTRFILRTLDRGDIFTHLATPFPGGVLDGAKRPVPELLEARAAGVWLDAGVGSQGFSYAVACDLAEAGVHPDTISTDLAARNRRWPVYSLMECMAKFMALGYGLKEVVSMTTTVPARVLGREAQLGAIAVGREADLTIMDVVPGRWKYDTLFSQKPLPGLDSKRETFIGERAIVPVQTIRAGELYAPEWGSHPWGWLPEEA